MRKVGLAFFGLGLAGQLLLSAFYAVTNVFELYTNEWYSPTANLANVGGVLSSLLLLVGFIMVVVSLQDRVPGGQGSSPAPQGGWPHPDASKVPSAPPTVEDRLARLQALHHAGHVSSEELADQRAKVLEGL